MSIEEESIVFRKNTNWNNMSLSKTEALRKKAWAAHHSDQLAIAEKIYRELIELHVENEIPDSRDAINLGALLRTQGRLKEAIDHYKHFIKVFPNEISLRKNGINALFDAKEIKLAEEWIIGGIKINPNEIDMLQAYAKLQLIKGDRIGSRKTLEDLVDKYPKEIGALLDLGLTCHSMKDFDAAITAYESIMKIEQNDPRAIANLIIVLKEKGNFKKAEDLIESLTNKLTSHILIKSAIAGLFIEQSKYKEAEILLEALCDLDPTDSNHWLNRAACLRSLKIIVKGAQLLKSGLQWSPEDSDLQQALAQSLAEMGKHKAAIRGIKLCMKTTSQMKDSHLFNMQFIGAGYHLISNEDRKNLALEWERKILSASIANLYGDRYSEVIEDRRIRIGYLSADFANHPVGRFILPVLEAHDRKKVEVWGLNCSRKDDEMSKKIKESCDHWVDIRYATDLEAARLISDHNLDVIIELGGFTGFSRLALLIHKPAPIQLSYLGYYAPTYIKAIDGWIGDETLFATLDIVDKSNQEIININGGYMAFRPHIKMPSISERKSAKAFRFGTFNNSRKLTNETINLFSQILEIDKKCELVLKSISFVEEEEQIRVKNLFIEKGIKKERIIILPWIEGWANHMNMYKEIDVALDPMPYGGATTSCEALSMGVPVISLSGKGMVGRLTASILTYSGCNEWLASSEKEYIDIAKRLISLGIRTKKQRNDLRRKVQNSELGDARRLCKEIENNVIRLSK